MVEPPRASREKLDRSWSMTLKIWIDRFREAQRVIREQEYEVERRGRLIEALAARWSEEELSQIQREVASNGE